MATPMKLATDSTPPRARTHLADVCGAAAGLLCLTALYPLIADGLARFATAFLGALATLEQASSASSLGVFG